MRKMHKRILIGVGIVVVVLGTLYAVALTKAQARLRRAYAAQEADGRPMLAAEVIPEAIPEAENAAPLFAAAARPLKELAKSFIYDLLDRLQTYARRFVDGSIHPEDLELFKGYMEQDVVNNSLQLFEQGLQRPKCRFMRDYDKGLWVDPLGLWVDPHEAGDMRSLLRIRRAKIRLEDEAAAEEVEGSWDRVFMQFRLADALRLDPILGSQTTRYGMARTGCRFAQDLCATNPPDARAYQKLQQILLALDDVTPMLRALDGERLLKGEWLFNLPTDKMYEILSQDESGAGNALFRIFFVYVKFKPRLAADHAAYLEMMLKEAQILQAPYDPDTRPAFRDLVNKSYLTKQMRPWVDHAKQWQCRIAAHARITRAGLALLKYKQVQGAYPASLDALDLEGLTDPFSQKPLFYHAEGENFSIYSVGENQQDNQGKPWESKHDEYDDIAWHFPPLSERTGASDPNEV
jgi:hypothetical protein